MIIFYNQYNTVSFCLPLWSVCSFMHLLGDVLTFLKLLFFNNQFIFVSFCLPLLICMQFRTALDQQNWTKKKYLIHKKYFTYKKDVTHKYLTHKKYLTQEILYIKNIWQKNYLYKVYSSNNFPGTRTYTIACQSGIESEGRSH